MNTTNSRVTLELQGEVDSEQLASAIVGFAHLIRNLSREVARGAKIEWIVEEMSAGSLSATLVGQSENPETVERVVQAYATVGHAIADKRPIPYSDAVQNEAFAITGVLNGRIKSVKFETPREAVVVYSEQKMLPQTEEKPVVAFGAIEGNVQTLTNRGALKFTLYDSLYDRAVTCYLHEGQEDLMRNAWGKRVIVQGLLTRDPETSRPIEIRRITDVIPVIAGDYKAGRGALKSEAGEPSPEEVIRRLRDA